MSLSQILLLGVKLNYLFDEKAIYCYFDIYFLVRI